MKTRDRGPFWDDKGLHSAAALIRRIGFHPLINGAAVMTWCAGYAEPGYTPGERGILFANWNPQDVVEYSDGIPCVFPEKGIHCIQHDSLRNDRYPRHACRESVREDRTMSRLAEIAEKSGYEIEWSDEWSTCSECGNAFRTSGDSHWWTRYYRIIGDGEICLDCLTQDPAEYLETIQDDPNTCCPPEIDPGQHGYVLVEDRCETGLHVGMDDSPRERLEALRKQGINNIIFRLSDSSQFYSTWQVWQRLPDEEDSSS